jgi:hypothetical protein
MSFDINTIINNAIAQAVNEAVLPLAARISDLEEANTILTNRLNEETVRLALNHDKLVERVSELKIKLHALDMRVLNGVKYSGMDYFQQDAITNAFVEKLNAQEWFWDKINHYVDTHIERRESESVTIDSFPELFAVEFNRKADPHAVLSREDVAEVVKELWAEDFEPDVRDIAERTVEDFDMDDKIRCAVRDYNFSDAVESVLEDMDWGSKIEDVLEDFDMDSKIENGIDSYDFDFESKIRDVLRNARIDISL